MKTETLADNEFYLANYGTDENIEIFKNYYHAKKESIDGNVYRCELNEELVFFEEDIQEWNYEDENDLFLDEPKETTPPDITKDNIHLYYEFMSEKDLLCYALKDTYYSTELEELTNSLLGKGFFLTNDSTLDYDYICIEPDGRLAGEDSYSESISGLKEINALKPIDEYIAEIKENPRYINYQLQELLKQNDRKYIKVCNIDDDIYSFSTMNAVYIGKYKHPTAKALDGENLLIEGVLYHGNINTYYEFMSDENKIEHKYILSSLFTERFYNLNKELGLNYGKLRADDSAIIAFGVARHSDKITSVWEIQEGDKQIEMSYFGVKDTLKPLYEYILQIKQSPGYQEIVKQDEFKYMMLSRLQADCKYFIGHGRGNPKNLFYSTVEEHIDEMKKLWEQIILKPEWLSLEEIKEYKQEMINIIPDKTFEEVEEYLNARAEKKASIRDIKTDPEPETPGGLKGKNMVKSNSPLRAELRESKTAVPLEMIDENNKRYETVYMCGKIEGAEIIDIPDCFYDDEGKNLLPKYEGFRAIKLIDGRRALMKSADIEIAYRQTNLQPTQLLSDIQTDPELETPEGLEQAKENLVNKLSQNSNTQDYN